MFSSSNISFNSFGLTAITILNNVGGGGGVVAQGKQEASILASHPAVPGSNPGSAKIFSLYCLVGGEY